MNQLTDANFFVEGRQLKLNARGNVMVLFTSLRCTTCKIFEPVFEGQIAGALRPQGWIFGKYIVEENPGMQVIHQSKSSTTVLSKSPTVILYSNGIPIGAKTGMTDAQTMINFATNILRNYRPAAQAPARQQPQQQQAPQQHYPPQQQAPNPRVPARRPPPRQQDSNIRYSNSGVPIIDGVYGVPYNMNSESDFLDYNQAYRKEAG